MWPNSNDCLPWWRHECYIRRGLNPQRAFTGLISSMIHSASKQLKHVKAIFLSKIPLCKKKKDSRIGTLCQGSGRSILARSDPPCDLFLYWANQAWGKVIFFVPHPSVIKVHCIGTSHQRRHSIYFSWSSNNLWVTVLRPSCKYLFGTASAQAALVTAAY